MAPGLKRHVTLCGRRHPMVGGDEHLYRGRTPPRQRQSQTPTASCWIGLAERALNLRRHRGTQRGQRRHINDTTLNDTTPIAPNRRPSRDQRYLHGRQNAELFGAFVCPPRCPSAVAGAAEIARVLGRRMRPRPGPRWQVRSPRPARRVVPRMHTRLCRRRRVGRHAIRRVPGGLAMQSGAGDVRGIRGFVDPVRLCQQIVWSRNEMSHPGELGGHAHRYQSRGRRGSPRTIRCWILG